MKPPPTTAAGSSHSTSADPALVLLHHFGGSATTWQPVIEAVGGDRHWLVPDLPGFGTRADHPGPFTVAAMADYVEALIAEHRLGNYVLVGHSMGGKVALALAARRPAGLRSLLLLAPSPPSPEPIGDQQRERQLAAWRSTPALSDIIDATTVRPLATDVRAALLDDMLAVSQPAWRAWLLHGSREDITGAVEQIDIPVLVASGDGDTTIPTAVLESELLPRLRAVALVPIAGAGHLLPIEAPVETAKLVVHG